MIILLLLLTTSPALTKYQGPRIPCDKTCKIQIGICFNVYCVKRIRLTKEDPASRALTLEACKCRLKSIKSQEKNFHRCRTTFIDFWNVSFSSSMLKARSSTTHTLYVLIISTTLQNPHVTFKISQFLDQFYTTTS